MKKIGELREGDSIYRIFPDFKEFKVRGFNPNVYGRSDLMRYKIVCKDEHGITDIIYPSKESARRSSLICIKTLSSTHIYATDPNFRIFYEKGRRTKNRRPDF